MHFKALSVPFIYFSRILQYNNNNNKIMIIIMIIIIIIIIIIVIIIIIINNKQILINNNLSSLAVKTLPIPNHKEVLLTGDNTEQTNKQTNILVLKRTG